MHTRERYFTNCAEVRLESTETYPGSEDLTKVHNKHGFTLSVWNWKGSVERKSRTLINIQVPSERPPAALCCTQGGVLERSLKEEKVQHLGAVYFIPNIDLRKANVEHHCAGYSCSNVFPPLWVALCPLSFPKVMDKFALKMQQKRNVAEYPFIQTTSRGIFNGRKQSGCGKIKIL